MNEIDTSTWKDFIVGELFPTIVKPPVLHSKDVLPSDTGIPYVVRTKFNNGIKCRVKQTKAMRPSPSGVISFGAENATFFYQEEPFVSGRDIYYIDTRHLTKYAALFVTVCLQTITQKYSYNYGMFPDLVKKDTIKLPVSVDGKPDYPFMDSYMRGILQKTKINLDRLVKTDKTSSLVDTRKWKDYHIGDLFEKLQLEIKKYNFNKAMDVSKVRTEEFNLPLVNAKHGNNGIMYYGREADWDSAEMTIDIVADGAASTGDVYAQPQRTGVLYNAFLIKPIYSQLSKETLLFFATVIQKCVKDHFGYENKCTWDRLRKEIISIPSTPDGKPDFVFMDQFMCDILKNSNSSLTALRTALRF